MLRERRTLQEATVGMQTFAGKTAVVTGAASGIGLALAERLAAAWMRVALADVEPEAVKRAATA
jgi:NAD(P)-dependent dehydrogenase (short-subunit alcohol dehydrogenase family)